MIKHEWTSDDGSIRLICADCLEVLPTIEAGSVDAVIADLPYGTTACSWDSVIPFQPLWAEYNRIIKRFGAIALTASQPFTSAIVMSNLAQFKYRWVWKKTRPGGFVSAKLKPLKNTEDICVFSSGTVANGSDENMPYFPQGVGPGKKWRRPAKYTNSPISYTRPSHAMERVLDGSGYPREIIEFANPNHEVLHPTQKPVALMEYLVRTYTNEGETVLDNTMGSGTTGVACVKTNRKFIGVEISEEYFEIAVKRIKAALIERSEQLIPA